MARHFAVTLKRSGAGRKPDQRATLKGMGLTKMHKTVFLKDTAPIRGMIYKVIHLVAVEARDGAPPQSKRAHARAEAQA